MQSEDPVDQRQRTLAAAKVIDLDGNEVSVESLWTGRATLFVFLRQYG